MELESTKTLPWMWHHCDCNRGLEIYCKTQKHLKLNNWSWHHSQYSNYYYFSQLLFCPELQHRENSCSCFGHGPFCQPDSIYPSLHALVCNSAHTEPLPCSCSTGWTCSFRTWVIKLPQGKRGGENQWAVQSCPGNKKLTQLCLDILQEILYTNIIINISAQMFVNM